MRFREIILESSEEGTLITLIQYLANRIRVPGTDSKPVAVPIDIVLRMMNNTGAGYTIEDLSALINNSDVLRNIVKISGKKLEIQHHSDEADTAPPEDIAPPPDEGQAAEPALPGTEPAIPGAQPVQKELPGMENVEKMASKAANKIY